MVERSRAVREVDLLVAGMIKMFSRVIGEPLKRRSRVRRSPRNRPIGPFLGLSPETKKLAALVGLHHPACALRRHHRGAIENAGLASKIEGKPAYKVELTKQDGTKRIEVAVDV